MFIDAHGEGGKIEMGVVVNGKGELMRIHIFENNEPEKVKQQPFLRQFENKKAPAHLRRAKISQRLREMRNLLRL